MIPTHGIRFTFTSLRAYKGVSQSVSIDADIQFIGNELKSKSYLLMQIFKIPSSVIQSINLTQVTALWKFNLYQVCSKTSTKEPPLLL